MDAPAELPSPLRITEHTVKPMLGRHIETPGVQPNRQPTPQQKIFSLWTQGNGMGLPRFIPRADWESRKTRQQVWGRDHPSETPASLFLGLEQDDMQHVTIPEDIHPWEVIPLLKELDQTLPAENRKERGAEIAQLATQLRNGGIFLATRLQDAFPEEMQATRNIRAREIAQTMAQEFYGYGESLLTGTPPPEGATVESIIEQDSTNSLSSRPDQEAAAGRFLFGEQLYDRRMNYAQKTREDQLRVQAVTIRQLFRTVATAEELQNQDKRNVLKGPRPQPWESQSVHNTFLAGIRERALTAADRPSAELTLAFLDIGMQHVRDHLPADAVRQSVIQTATEEITTLLNAPVDEQTPERIEMLRESRAAWSKAEGTLRKGLQIDTLKQQLIEVKQSGNTEEIAKAEAEAVSKIQDAISRLPFDETALSAASVVEKQMLQCVTASLLGSTFLSELGITHLVGDIPEHATFFVVLADNSLWWQDMQLAGGIKTEITTYFLQAQGNPNISAEAIAEFAKHPDASGGINFSISNDALAEIITMPTDTLQNTIRLLPPEKGIAHQILSNESITLYNLEDYAGALAAADKALELDPGSSDGYLNHASPLSMLGRHKEALAAADKALELDPNNVYAYIIRGNVIAGAGGNPGEALYMFNKAIRLNPTAKDAYSSKAEFLVNIDREDEAIETYQQLLRIVDDRTEQKQIKRRIRELKWTMRGVALLKRFNL